MEAQLKPRVVLAAGLALAAAAAVWWAWRSPSTISPDEIFQNVEQAFRALHHRGIVPWEFRRGVRSWLLPGFLAGVLQVGGLVGASIVLALGALAVPLTAHATARRFGAWPAVIAALVCAGWVELLVFAPRPLTEVVAAHLLLPGLYLAQARRRLAVAGALLGLAFVLRMHVAPAVLAGAIWAGRGDLRRWARLAAGAAVPLAAAGIVDLATWGRPFYPMWQNFVANILEGRAAGYGEAGPLAYLVAMARVWGWCAVPLVALAAVGARRAPLYAVAAVAILAAHAAIAHKESRFIYPAIALLIVLAAAGTAELVARRPPLAAVALALWGVMSWDTSRRLDEGRELVFPPARAHGVPLWQVRRGPLLAFRALAQAPRPCGIGLIGVAWWETGGYSGLGHDSPIYTEWFPEAHDVVVTNVPNWNVAGWKRVACFDEACIFRRGGTCRPIPEQQVNAAIARRGE